MERPRTSPKTGAPNDREGHQSVTSATDRGHDDPPAWPQDSAPLYPPHHYIRHVKRFADFLGQSADTATAEDVHRYQLWLASIGTTVPTVNARASALRFFFNVTLKRRDLAEEVVSAREPRRLPVVLSPEEVGRLLASARNIKHKALFRPRLTGTESLQTLSWRELDSNFQFPVTTRWSSRAAAPLTGIKAPGTHATV